jgi:putative peptidoglycan lipid II flippase
MDSMAVLLAPLSALCVALAVPAMSVLAFGQADTAAGVELLAAALAGLCLGLVPYGAFFLLARAWYVLEDSRRPAVAGICGAAVGVAGMGLSAWLLHGAALVAGLGLAHTLAFCVAAGILVVGLHRRTGTWAVSRLQGSCLVAAVLVGIVAWGAHQWWAPSRRGLQLVELLVLSGIVLGAYAAMLRLGGVSVLERLRVRSVEGRS